jgi:N-acetylmuramate 1-kinase
MNTNTNTINIDARLEDIQNWLVELDIISNQQYKFNVQNIAPASSDASFRRYFRVYSQTEKTSYIIMDAPVEHEDCKPFIKIANLFATSGANLPKIIEQDLEQGFLLLSDLGGTTYLQAFNTGNNYENDVLVDKLYGDAGLSLLDIQKISQPGVLPAYDEAVLLREMHLFNDWYLLKHHNYELTTSEKSDLDNIYSIIISNNLAQHKVYVHRDYHCRNLMYIEGQKPGILDFQDALYGPITYDLVSLWRDAYIEWSEDRQINWLIKFWQNASVNMELPSFDQFYIDYEYMGLQRHLKVLGIFARLYHRDGKDGYLKDLPLVQKYVMHVAKRYDCFLPLARILNKVLSR